MIVEVIIGLLLFIAALNLWASVRVVRDQLSTPWQRASHILLIWLLPVLGALIVLQLQRAEPEPSPRRYATDPALTDDCGYIGKTLRQTDTGGLGTHDADA